ncbi:hypothetical protein P7E02_11525 [Enterococcus hulanensis]|uniref:hypothetical protein n=1 Tax=Enterococcus hulanensis TaxID=2559929 RepID=UPI002892355A|nr:hypothetical protein [Enterococcus hulanensis]MDT2660502.1 hypothetical protein [Enterococcus hulanensis]
MSIFVLKLKYFPITNEVIQSSNNQLEAKFYLLKNPEINQEMYACLYNSTDNAETWKFIQELFLVEKMTNQFMKELL